jgi:aryl-alcohol dehydrogenase-like predicted oxidoreductase
VNFNLLGRTGLQVSELCFGTMSFGGDADAKEAEKMYRAARQAGINFFDCANVYNNGEAEKILGQLIANERDEIIITSKCAMPTSEDINDRGASRRHIRSAVEGSLKRLNTDRIDVFLMHRWDENTPLEETLRGLEDLVREGKILYTGASNYAAWQVMKALGLSARQGLTRFDVIQPMYNLVRRQAESEILPLALSENLGVMTYGPVGGGLLSGKYAPGSLPPSGRLVDNLDYKARYDENWVYETAGRFTRFAAELNCHPVSLAVAWVAAHPGVTCPIIGARNLQQLQPSIDSINVDMDEDLRDSMSALSREPALATDRLEEKRS